MGLRLFAQFCLDRSCRQKHREIFGVVLQIFREENAGREACQDSWDFFFESYVFYFCYRAR